MKLKSYILRFKWQIIGTLAGLLAGYLYWYFIGCTSGTCPTQANWHSSTLYGGLLGYFVSDLKKKPKNKQQKSQEHGEV